MPTVRTSMQPMATDAWRAVSALPVCSSMNGCPPAVMCRRVVRARRAIPENPCARRAVRLSIIANDDVRYRIPFLSGGVLPIAARVAGADFSALPGFSCELRFQLRIASYQNRSQPHAKHPRYPCAYRRLSMPTRFPIMAYARRLVPSVSAQATCHINTGNFIYQRRCV